MMPTISESLSVRTELKRTLRQVKAAETALHNLLRITESAYLSEAIRNTYYEIEHSRDNLEQFCFTYGLVNEFLP